MTVRHIVMFTWRDDVTPGQIESIRSSLLALSTGLPGVESYQLGPDVGVNEGNHDFVVIGDFASLADYLHYRDHPEHQRIVDELIKPSITARSAIQVDLG